MDNLIFTINAVVPIFLLVGLGYFIRRKNMVSDTFLQEANKLGFRILLPVMLFNNVYSVEINEVMDAKLVLYCVLGLCGITGVSMLASVFMEKENPRRGAIAQAMARPNSLLFGVPLINNLFGEGAVPVISGVLAIIIPLMNVLAVILLSVFGGHKISIKRILLDIAKNPLIHGAVLGVLVGLLPFEMPVFLSTAVNDVGKIATPLALLVLGGQFKPQSVRKNLRSIGMATFGRLVVVPAVMLGLAALLGFRGVDMGVVLVAFAAPTAVVSFVMAQNMGADSELASQLVLSTTVFSVFTLFLFIYVLKACALL